MLSALLATLLSANPATGLTLSAQMGKVNTPADAYLDAIEQELITTQLPVRRLALTCEGKRECLLAATKTAGLPALVAVTVAYGKKQTTLDLEALRVGDGATVSQLTFSVAIRLSETDRAAVRKFGAQLAASLAETKTDAPLAEPKPDLVVVTPPPKLELVPAPEAPKRSRVPAWVLGGGAVASAVTSGVFLGLAASEQAALYAPRAQPDFTRSEAEGRAAAANTAYTVSLATGIAAGALATAAILWLVTE